MQADLCLIYLHMSLVLRKPGLWGFRPGLTQTGLYSHSICLESCNFIFRKKRDCTICVAKTKALISFAVTAKLICIFVFAYAKSRFFSQRGSYHIRFLFSWPGSYVMFGFYALRQSSDHIERSHLS